MASRKRAQPARLDRLGDALPKHAVQRLGSERLRTTADITAIALSADAQTVAAATTADSIHVWNAASGAPIAVLELPRTKSSYSIKWMQFSGDASAIYVVKDSLYALDVASGRVTCTFEGSRTPCAVGDDWLAVQWGTWTKILTSSGKQLATLEADADVLALSPDGKRLAVLVAPREEAQQLQLFDTATWKLLKTWAGAVEGKGTLARQALAFSRDSKQLHVVWDDASQQTFSLPTGKVVADLPADKPGKARSMFEYHPDKRCVLAANGTAAISVQYQRCELRRPDGSTCKLAEPLTTGALAMSADGTTIAAAEKHVVRIFDVATGEEKRPVDTHAQHIVGVAFSPAGDAVITFDAGTTARAWETETGASLPLKHGPHLPPETRSLFVMKRPDHETELVNVLDRNAGFKLGARSWDSAAFADDNSVLALAFPRDADTDEKARIEVWSIPQRKKLVEIAAQLKVISLSRDGRLLVGCAWEIDDLRIWKLPSGRKLRFFKSDPERDHGSAVWDHLELSGDASQLAGANGGKISIWSVDDGKRLRDWKLRKDVQKLAFSPDGDLLAAGTEEGFRLWAVTSGKEVARGAEPTFDLRFSDDGTRLVTAGRGSALVWDVGALTG